MDITIRQMCEHIEKAEILAFKDGSRPTAKQIFNYSPTGELYKIWDWYDMACFILEHDATGKEFKPRFKIPILDQFK
jgi:hypothetical protein